MPTYSKLNRLQGLFTFGAVAYAMGWLLRPAVSDRIPKSSPELLPNVPIPGLSNPTPSPFKTLTAPNPKFKRATVGILIAPQYSAQAAGFARYVAAQINTKGRWTKTSLYIFTNPKDAEAFKRFQAPRVGRPLHQADFVRLTSLWRGVPVYYEKAGRMERIFHPNKNPQNWWRSLVTVRETSGG